MGDPRKITEPCQTSAAFNAWGEFLDTFERKSLAPEQPMAIVADVEATDVFAGAQKHRFAAYFKVNSSSVRSETALRRLSISL